MPQAGGPTVLVVQAMGLTGTIIGDGVQALEVDGVMVQARAGHLMGMGRVMDLVLDLGLGLGVGQVPGMVMGLEVVVLMVVVTGLEVDKAIPVAAVLVEELVVQTGTVTAGPQVTETIMVKGSSIGLLARRVWFVCSIKYMVCK